MRLLGTEIDNQLDAEQILEQVSISWRGLIWPSRSEQKTLPDDFSTEKIVDGLANIPEVQDIVKIIVTHGRGRRYHFRLSRAEIFWEPGVNSKG